jgi:hypothetical protein
MEMGAEWLARDRGSLAQGARRASVGACGTAGSGGCGVAREEIPGKWRDPSPLPCFLEVLIIVGLERDFLEVLIIKDFKSIGENKIRGVLEVLIIKGLKFDFSEVLILGGLGATNFEL